MTLFTSLGRRRTASGSASSGRELPEAVLRSLPEGFEAVAEALHAAEDARPACAVVGRAAARSGAALGEALDGLRTTFRLMLGADPDFEVTEAMSVAWSEATLDFVHDLSCEDPLTGLASLAHLRTRLDEVYRTAGQSGAVVPWTHALVVVEMAARSPRAHVDPFSRALNLVQITELARAVFSGEETIARLGADRAAVVVRRGPQLGTSVALLRDLVGDLDLGPVDVRLWIEGLPGSQESAVALLGELARS